MNSCLRLVVCALLGMALQEAAHADSADDIASSSPGPEPFIQVLDAASLEALGARIGRIEIVVDDVFEPPTGLSAPYRIANALHITTHSDAVRSQLLFQSGDRFERRLLDETERKLRERRYLSEARIEPLAYHADGSVDVQVRVHDVWTLLPSFSVGRKGGRNNAEVEIEDTNLLGLGKEVSIEQSTDVDRDTLRLLYRDPNLFGSRWRLSSAYLTSSDGGERTLDVGRPFYSLDSRWSLQFNSSEVTETRSRYSLGQVVDEFDTQRQSFGVGAGLSSGLREGWARRLLAGIRYENRSFAPTDRGLEPPLRSARAVPEDRRLVSTPTGSRSSCSTSGLRCSSTPGVPGGATSSPMVRSAG